MDAVTYDPATLEAVAKWHDERAATCHERALADWEHGLSKGAHDQSIKMSVHEAGAAAIRALAKEPDHGSV